MAKKRAIANLKTKNIKFMLGRVSYKVLTFNPNNMTLDVAVEDENSKTSIKNFPFAHAPKEIKKLIKPN